jgi:hypothetical protein
MSKYGLKLEFLWKGLKIQTQTGYFLISISRQSLDFRTSPTLAKFNVTSEWQEAQNQ